MVQGRRIPIPQPGELWQHYKTESVYEILHIARIEATQELAVVYSTPDRIQPVWVRPLSEFVALVGGAPRFKVFEGPWAPEWQHAD